MLLSVLFGFLVVGVLGGLFGIGLSYAAKLFAVKKDERVEQIESVLPGINCGACGFPGCAGYAAAVGAKTAPLTLCAPGGPAVAVELGAIMGVAVEATAARKVAQVHCRGGRDVSTYDFEYTGMPDCNALHVLYGGDKTCKFGCLQLGSCIRVCPVDAIDYDADGKIWIDKELCIACGKCLTICPTKVIKWVPYDADVLVACNNTDKGAAVRKYCKVGCIGCKICDKKSPEGGYIIENNLSHIDYTRTGDRLAGAQACPPKCIIEAPVSAPAPAEPVAPVPSTADEST